MKSAEKQFLRSLRREVLAPPPIWLMRQAGRYLPEYRKTRAKAPDFLEFCLTPELAVEATLQPIRRYGFDAAIVFSDILVVPHGVGQRVWFEEGQGPCLEPISRAEDLKAFSIQRLSQVLAPVYRTLEVLRGELPADIALIGFAGAPWTVASYMIEGGSSRDFARAKAWAYGSTETFQRLIDFLVEATVTHLIHQVEAGAEALQIFDSWAGVWPESALRRWCLEPAKQIVQGVKAAHPEVPIILFPRGAGPMYRSFAAESGADGLSLDTVVPLAWARDCLQDRITLQGNLDPLLLVAGGAELSQAVEDILDTFAPGPFIFNLGHGIVPQTPLDHVAALVEQVRAWRPK